MNVKLMKTKAGKGFKIVVDQTWYYTSVKEVMTMLADKSAAVTFREIEEVQEHEQRQTI